MKIWICVFLFVSGITIHPVFGLRSGDFSVSDSVLSNYSIKQIHTVLLHVKGNDFSMPVIRLNSDQKLELRFDDLSVDPYTYAYTLVHCDAEWKKSALPEQDYLSGFGSGNIRDVATSFNTTFDYRHYHLDFPEEECMPTISGNYVIQVYDEDDPGKIVLSRRFYVTEETAEIAITVGQPVNGPDRETGQQVQFTVNYNSSEIRDPIKQVLAVAMQNGRYDRQIFFEKPFIIQPGKMEYTDPDRGIFSGGNEFRSLDIKSMRYQTQNIASIDFRNPYYHVLLKPDEDRSRKPYFSDRDLNGKYYVDVEKSNNRYVQADYIYVHFNLKLPMLYADDRIYVAGGFNDWQPGKSNEMLADESSGLYTATILLKQGLYDYCYMKNTEASGFSETEIEGSHFETENTYSIFIYFHDQFKRYDRLIGYTSTK